MFDFFSGFVILAGGMLWKGGFDFGGFLIPVLCDLLTLVLMFICDFGGKLVL